MRETGAGIKIHLKNARFWLQLEVTQLWAEQGSFSSSQQVFFLVWFLSSRDNPFYLARQLNCFHFSFI